MSGLTHISLAETRDFIRAHRTPMLVVALVNVTAGLGFLYFALAPWWLERAGPGAALLVMVVAWVFSVLLYAMAVTSIPLAILAVPFTSGETLKTAVPVILAAVVLLGHLLLTRQLHASWSRLPDGIRWLGLTIVTLTYNLASITVMVLASLD